MKILRTVADVRASLAGHRADGPVGLVPTMGALHAGHVALMAAARARSATVVASIFVNPKQFNDATDLAAYPRQEAEDLEIAAAAGVDIVFAPDAREMFNPDHATTVDVAGPALGYEDAHRPGHFRGMATVCLELFTIVRPAAAFFGQKDAQQAAVIRRLVDDLHLELDVVVVPTVREADDVALSSRNTRLSPEERARARAIPLALRAGLAAYAAGADPAAAARRELSGLEIVYAEVAYFDGYPTLVIAARAGRTRLIDNVPLDRPELAGLGPACLPLETSS